MNLSESSHAARRKEREYMLFAAYGRRIKSRYAFKDADQIEYVVPDAHRAEFDRLQKRSYELMARISGWESSL